MNAVLRDSFGGMDFFDDDYCNHRQNHCAYADNLYDDNSSYSGGGSSKDCDYSCLPCPDGQPLWFLVLRFMKMKVLNMARSYNAKPAVLIAAPLIVGIMIGFCLGKATARETATATMGPRYSTMKDRDSSSKNTETKPFSRARIHSPKQLLASIVHHLSLQWQEMNYRSTVATRSIIYRMWSFNLIQQQSKISTIDLAEDSSAQLHRTNTTDVKTLEKTSVVTFSDESQDDDDSDGDGLRIREDRVRSNLNSSNGTDRESGVPLEDIPRHIAVIMDGNRRYGKAKYGNASRGHWEGSSKLVEFAKWCLAEHVEVLTVFAFSTENWKRDPAEVASLMEIFVTYCDELRREALERNIKIISLSTNRESIPSHVQERVRRMVEDTKHCNGLIMNICLSYGSRSEIAATSRSLAVDAVEQKLDPRDIDETMFGDRLLTHGCGDPDVLIRTSGEVRLSNFLLWQLAYTELFFIEKPWPAVEKKDLLDVIQSFAHGRSRRFGK
jgi:undecaprenyl diphosphate synthase